MTGAAVGLFAWTGMLASASISTPQVVRLARRHSSLGVNQLTWSLSLCCFGCWCAYGAIRPLYFQVPGNAISMVGTFLLLGMLVRKDRTGLPYVIGTVVLASGAALLLFHYFAAPGIGWLAFFFAASMRVPQLSTTIQTRQLGGVSPLTWMLSAIASVAWSGYGIILHDWPIVASSVWGFGASATILFLTLCRLNEPRLTHKLLALRVEDRSV
jgi:uncharacterized protein with PQ loop repeat